MNRQEKVETQYVLDEDVIGGGSCPSLESYSTVFSLPELNTRDYASHIEVVPQQPHQSRYRNPFLALPDPTSQLMQSMINQDLHYQTISGKLLQPYFDSSGKSQSNSGISLFTGCHAQSSGKERTQYGEGFACRNTTAEFACRNTNMEKVLNSSWKELAGLAQRGNYHSSNSWMGSTTVQNIVQSEGAATGKQRIRWTHELHEQFVEAVNSLGGAMKATPKGILRLMKSQGLTIFHIKSHLQKYRTAKCIPNYLEGKNGRRTNHDEMPMSNLNGNGGFQMSEALRLQMDVQKSLHEHLEFQKKLQMRIEEHANYLQKMFDEQKTSHSFSESYNPDKVTNPSIAECSSTGGFGYHDDMFTTKLDP